MKHRHVRNMLNDYVDGLLDDELKADVDRHLSSCPNCREQLEHVRTVREELGGLHRVSAPPDFLKSVHRRMETSSPPERSLSKPFGNVRVFVPAGVAAVATATIALIFVLNVIQPRRDARETVARSVSETPTERVAPETTVEPAPEGDIGDEYTLQEHPIEEHTFKKEEKVDSALETRSLQETGKDVLEQPYAAAKRAESEAMRDDTQTPVLSLRLLEEIGDVSDDDAFGEGFRSAELQSRSMQKAAQEEKEVDRLEEEPSYSEDVAEEHAVASQTAADFQSIVENLVRDSGGSVRTVDYGERYEIPKSMVVQIPLETLENFIRDLRQYAEIDLSGELILSEELAGTGVSVGAGEQVQTVMIGILFQ